jgi:hypothetical protein
MQLRGLHAWHTFSETNSLPSWMNEPQTRAETPQDSLTTKYVWWTIQNQPFSLIDWTKPQVESKTPQDSCDHELCRSDHSSKLYGPNHKTRAETHQHIGHVGCDNQTCMMNRAQKAIKTTHQDIGRVGCDSQTCVMNHTGMTILLNCMDQTTKREPKHPRLLVDTLINHRLFSHLIPHKNTNRIQNTDHGPCQKQFVKRTSICSRRLTSDK